jgi:hypothetical protein
LRHSLEFAPEDWRFLPIGIINYLRGADTDAIPTHCGTVGKGPFAAPSQVLDPGVFRSFEYCP